MRKLSLVVLFLVVACHRQSRPQQTSSEITFDGAQVTSAAAMVAHGERISWVLGCRDCHGDKLEGDRFYERYASNLTRELPNYSDAEIERVLRTGVPRDGRKLWRMPSRIFQYLSAADMRALIADLRSTAPGGTPTQPPKPWDAEAQAMIARGDLKSAKDTVTQDKSIAPIELGPKYSLGRYITRVTCAECHGPRLEGDPASRPGEPPNLIVVGGYTRAEFETLMTKGIPSGGRKLKNPLMGEVARGRFTHLTQRERDAIYAYLKARAEEAQ